MSIKIQAKDCQSYEQATQKEWLETNGIGGYASSSISGCNTRKYHGLLVSRLENPEGKFVLLSKIDDSLIDSNREETWISTNKYVETIAPHGYKNMVGFVQDKIPTFKYQFPKANVTKKIAMVHGKNTVITRYECTKNTNHAKLVIRPLLAYRDFHTLASENVFLQVRTYPAKNGFKIEPYQGMPAIYIQTNGEFDFFPAPNWYRGFEYEKEIERGFDSAEDLFCPGMFEIKFEKGTNVLISASTEELDDVDAVFDEETSRRSAFYKRLRGTSFQKPLKWAANQFISTKPSGHKAITAGFPWFLEWGRDAMIALPGLLLHDDKKNPTYVDVLKEFAINTKDGVVPNYLGPNSTNNAYNSVDAGLWFAWATQQYLHKTKDIAALKGTIFKTLEQVYTHYKKGTMNNIHMLENGLISAGSHDSQITWMDANSNGQPVTPRNGCPVEINALWYNFICFLCELIDMGELSNCKDAKELAPKIKDSFQKEFWISDENYLADLINEHGQDKSVRPNQIFAVSLPHSALSKQQAEAVVKKVTDDLLTPLGLRTLSPNDERYRGEYKGGPEQRDSAYHNGTVWPWLIGHYVEALIKVDSSKKTLESIDNIIESFRHHLLDDGIGTISEIFDGDSPAKGHGCSSQAWSVAELLRVVTLYDKAKKKK